MDTVVDWLMEGDPAIRWQTMRDLLDSYPKMWQLEQRSTLKEGWGAKLLSLQGSDGQWGGGLYSPKWISTTYTLLALHSIGVPRNCKDAQRGTQLVLDGLLGRTYDRKFEEQLVRCDRCIVGMLLLLAVYFDVDDERIDAMVKNLLHEIMPDGGWNCKRQLHNSTHSSFHTTLNVLEGLREYVELRASKLRKDVLTAEQMAMEFMLEHKLFRSDKTGQIIDEKFTLFAYPYYWHYDVLRGLSYFARVNAPHDRRLQDAIDLLERQRLKDGTWAIRCKYPGRVYFDMEKAGKPSRWNTLRALRVLRWWNNMQQKEMSL